MAPRVVLRRWRGIAGTVASVMAAPLPFLLLVLLVTPSLLDAANETGTATTANPFAIAFAAPPGDTAEGDAHAALIDGVSANTTGSGDGDGGRERGLGSGIEGETRTTSLRTAPAPRRSLTSQYTGPRADYGKSRPIARQSSPSHRTIISQANVGALATEFRTVLSFSLPLDHEDLLMANGAVVSYKSHALRIWCVEMAPKDRESRTQVELSDVLFLHDQYRESSYWQKHTHSMQHLADKGVRSFACDLPGFGRSEGDRNLARAPQKTRAFILSEIIRLCGTVRPVIVSPTTSGAYSMPLLISNPTAMGGYLVDSTVGAWGGNGAQALQETETMMEFIKSSVARLPEKGIEIPIKVLIGAKQKTSALSGLWRNLAAVFPVSEVVEVQGGVGAEVYNTSPKEFNDLVVRLCSLAALSNGHAGQVVRATLRKKHNKVKDEVAKSVAVVV